MPIDKDALAVLRDSREEESGLCFDAALERFSKRLGKRARSEDWGHYFSRKSTVLIEVRKRWISVSIQRAPIGIDNIYNYCLIDSFTGDVHKLSKTKPCGHIFQSDWDVRWRWYGPIDGKYLKDS